MPLWIDNTGLHSSGRALDGRALGRIDVEGLLQLATLLVFGDSLLINGFESSPVSARSTEIREQLVSMGVAERVIQIVDCPSDAYWRTCTTAANLCAKQLRWGFVTSSGDGAGTQPELPNDHPFTLHEFFRMSTGQQAIPDPAAIRLDAEGRRAEAALHYMLASSPPLGAAIKEVIEKTPWSASRTSQLDAYIRLFLNNALASRVDALYTPAVARARTVRQYREHLIVELTRYLDEKLAKVIGTPLSMPAVASALLKRSKGDKRALVEEALAMRQDAKPLRIWIAKLSARHVTVTPDSYLEATRELRQLVNDAISRLRLDNAGDGFDVVTYGVPLDLGSFGPPTLKLSPASVAAAVRRRFRRRQTAVLTEISKYALYPETEQVYYKRLMHECGV